MNQLADSCRQLQHGQPLVLLKDSVVVIAGWGDTS
jgi:hypothetical protein